MSSVSGIGSSTVQNLYQFIQGLSGGAAASSTAASPSGSSSTSNNPLQALGQALKGAGGHRHRHGGGSAMQQIQDAVSTALQTAQSTGSSADPNKVVEDAIAKVLQNDPSSPTPAQQGTTTGNANGSTASGGTSATTGQTFNQLLQSFGISPEQFREDFLSAVKDAQNGTANPATAFQSVPIGSTLDTVA